MVLIFRVLEDADPLLVGWFWPLLLLQVRSKGGDVGTQPA